MNNAHGIIGDEMGLGKTLQILSFFQLVKSLEKGDNRPFFVICPLSVLAGWQIEIDTWTNLKAIQWYGSGEKRRSTSQIVKNQGMADLFFGFSPLLLSRSNTVFHDHRF
jgi:SWI/SNF-related matrix-associated actin-dependent regulator of chromatin subfamily A member 5